MGEDDGRESAKHAVARGLHYFMPVWESFDVLLKSVLMVRLFRSNLVSWGLDLVVFLR